MSEHADGTVYGKYIKIKNGPAGVKKCTSYILDPEKVQAPFNGQEQDIPCTQSALSYISNDPKVVSPSTGKRLVSGHNCSPDTAAREFSLVEKLYHTSRNENLAPGQKANQAFHIILSYKGTSTDPEMVHEMGCEFARRLCGDEFQAVTATHLNTGNYHNHILVNAYALDGQHKFRDSYHVYRQFRDTANEISLEYGLPVFVNEENRQKQSYKSWKEFTATQEGQSWKEAIIIDLDRAVDAAFSYGEVLSAMKELGYEIQQNPRSVTFKKGNGRVRDSRLGYPYTRNGISARLDQKCRKKGFEQYMEEVRRTQKEQKTGLCRNIYISRYDRYGRRRSSLIRFLLTLKETVLRTMEDASGAQPEALSPEDSVPMSPGQKLARLDWAVRTADQYGITSPAVLEMKIRELHATNASCRSTVSGLENYLENAGEIKQMITEYQKLEPLVRSVGISPENLVFIPDASAIQGNLARMNPVTPRTRSRLFQAIHNSPYTLTKKFRTLTETDARQILTAIREQRRKNLPDGLVLWGRAPCIPDTPSTDTATPPGRQTPIVLKEYSQEVQQTVLDFKAAADHLASYGLTDQDSMNRFVRDMEKMGVELDQQKAISEKNWSELRALFRLKNYIIQFDTPILASTPVPSKNHDNAPDSTQTDHGDGATPDGSLYDTLAYMKTRLDRLSAFTQMELEAMEIPDPGEYRFLHDLQILYPDRKPPCSMTPKNVHYLLAKLKSEDFFEKEMQKELEKELEKERKHARNGKDNTL